MNGNRVDGAVKRIARCRLGFLDVIRLVSRNIVACAPVAVFVGGHGEPCVGAGGVAEHRVLGTRQAIAAIAVADGRVRTVFVEVDRAGGRPREVAYALARVNVADADRVARRPGRINDNVIRTAVPYAGERIGAVCREVVAVVDAVAANHLAVRHRHIEQVAVVVRDSRIDAVDVGHAANRVGVCLLGVCQRQRRQKPNDQNSGEQQIHRLGVS